MTVSGKSGQWTLCALFESDFQSFGSAAALGLVDSVFEPSLSLCVFCGSWRTIAASGWTVWGLVDTVDGQPVILVDTFGHPARWKEFCPSSQGEGGVPVSLPGGWSFCLCDLLVRIFLCDLSV